MACFRVSALAFFVITVGGVATAQGSDSFLCYKSRVPKDAPKFLGTTVPITDELETRSLQVKGPRVLCVPADLGDGVSDPDTNLLGYRAKLPRGSAKYPGENNVQILNDLGELYVDAKARPQLLLVPTATDPTVNPVSPDPETHSVDHYRCHKAKGSKDAAPFPNGQQISVLGLSNGPDLFDVKKPHELCEPVDALGVPIKNAANHLMCYRVKRASGEPKYEPVLGLHVNNQFDPATIDTKKEFEICLPSLAIGICNEFAELCDRAFDAISHPTTHNAMSNQQEGWLGPNQTFSVPHQLDDGVRALMLDTWYFGGDAVLCHGGDVFPCNVTGMKPLVDGLTEIREFLEHRPNEVVSIIFESYISEADTLTDFITSGLIDYVHTQPVGDPWPTLRELVESGERLIVFTDDSGASLPWHHYVWDFAWETHFSFQEPNDFSCNINRGSMSNSLFILNHFLTNPIAFPALADMVNHNPLFIDRAEQCQTESGRLPNFVTVDFYDIGDLFYVVDSLNELLE
jgi:hypothetical protein